MAENKRPGSPEAIRDDQTDSKESPRRAAGPQKNPPLTALVSERTFYNGLSVFNIKRGRLKSKMKASTIA